MAKRKCRIFHGQGERKDGVGRGAGGGAGPAIKTTGGFRAGEAGLDKMGQKNNRR